MHGFSCLEGLYVAILYCLSLGRPQEVIQRNGHFGGPIEEKVSCLEGCYVVILYCLRLGRLGNAWIFRFGKVLCKNSLLFNASRQWLGRLRTDGSLESLEGLEGM